MMLLLKITTTQRRNGRPAELLFEPAEHVVSLDAFHKLLAREDFIAGREHWRHKDDHGEWSSRVQPIILGTHHIVQVRLAAWSESFWVSGNDPKHAPLTPFAESLAAFGLGDAAAEEPRP